MIFDLIWLGSTGTHCYSDLALYRFVPLISFNLSQPHNSMRYLPFYTIIIKLIFHQQHTVLIYWWKLYDSDLLFSNFVYVRMHNFNYILHEAIFERMFVWGRTTNPSISPYWKLMKSEWPFLSDFLYWKRLIYGCHLTCKYIQMMLCYSKTRKIKYFLDPPPKKAHRYERSWYVYMQKCLSIPAAHDLGIY